MSTSSAPGDIVFEDDTHVHDIALHPSRNIAGAALVDGSVHLYEYAAGGATPKSLFSSSHHTDACRSILFTACGTGILTASKDRSIAALDVESGAVVGRFEKAHEHPINVLGLYDPNVLASGDDDGDLSLWDLRSNWHQPVLTWAKTENADYISDFCAVPSKHHLLVTCADGTLGVWDVRGRGPLVAMSDDVEDELLSVVVIKGGKKVVCGSSEGMLMVFTYGDFGDYDDRYPGHPNSIESLIAIDQDTICTASSDGIIRVVQIHPNKLLGVIGSYDFPVERIRLSHDREWIASSSHDGAVKFWESGFLFEVDDESADGEGNDDDERMEDVQAAVARTSFPQDTADFFSGLT